MRCHLCGFDLDECPGCGLNWGLADPDESSECPNCGADIPNQNNLMGMHQSRVELDPVYTTCFSRPVEREELLNLFPSI